MAKYIKFSAVLSADYAETGQDDDPAQYVRLLLTHGDKHQDDGFFGVTILDVTETSEDDE